ncbi:MAG TPA: discoidin domain-containing protein [Polyangiaceae bacterium]|nr:discoidin domain-containing protein [Polyangiaceae bacterium]
MSSKEAMAEARLSIDSARALFREGILSKCHAYMAVALQSLLDAWAPPSESEGKEAATTSERRERALSAISGAKYRRFGQLSAAYRAVEERAASDSRSSPVAGERDFERIWTEVDRLYRFSVRHFSPVEWRRRLRIGIALALTPVLLVVCLVLFLQHSRPHVDASSSYGPTYNPGLAVDRLIATEWLLADGEEGWIDLNFKAPRTVHGVTLSNCHNGAFADRGSAKVRVTAFSNDTVVATAEGEFSKISTERTDLELSLAGEKITRIRAEVVSHFGRGGGFAEIEVH